MGAGAKAVSVAVTERTRFSLEKAAVACQGAQSGSGGDYRRQRGSHHSSWEQVATLYCSLVQWDTEKSHPNQLNLLVLRWLEYCSIKNLQSE